MAADAPGLNVSENYAEALMGLLSRILGRREPVLFSLSTDATVGEAVKLMERERIGVVPIVDGDELLGVFSERDLLRRVIAVDKSVETTRLRDVMTPEPVTATPGETRDVAILKMRERGCRHLPIVEGGRVVDMLSMRDLLHEEIRDRENEIRVLQDYIQHGGMQGGGAS